MSTISGKFVKFATDVQTVGQSGKPYSAWVLTYTENGEYKNVKKPMQSLKFNRALEQGLRSLKEGDDFTLVAVKNEQGFLDYKSVEIGGSGSSSGTAGNLGAGSAGNRGYSGSASGGGSGRDFESRQERWYKQKLIVAQSCLAQAVATKGVMSEPAEVKVIAQDYYDFIMDLAKADPGSKAASSSGYSDDVAM